MKRELEYFFAALRFLTRLPVPAWVGHSSEQLNHAARYFTLVGAIVGAIGGGVTWAAAQALPGNIALLLGMAATLLATGAFHEDGFSDSVDGFGGGWEKLRILEIMKDSRVGSFGAIAITMILLTKFVALQQLLPRLKLDGLVAALIAAHALSRLASTSLLCLLDYVREDELAKSKPLARKLSMAEWSCAAVFGLAPLGVLLALDVAPAKVLIALALVVATTFYARRYLLKHLGGYTGDCLGATQQVAEIAVYLGLCWSI